MYRCEILIILALADLKRATKGQWERMWNVTWCLFFSVCTRILTQGQHDMRSIRTFMSVNFCKKVCWRSHKLFWCTSQKLQKKTLKWPTHNIWCTGRVPNQESPSYEAEVLRIHCDMMLVTLYFDHSHPASTIVGLMCDNRKITFAFDTPSESLKLLDLHRNYSVQAAQDVFFLKIINCYEKECGP